MERIDTLSSIILSILILAIGMISGHNCVKNMDNLKNNVFLIPNIFICIVYALGVYYKNNYTYTKSVISTETMLVNMVILALDHIFTMILMVTHYRRYNIEFLNIKTVSMMILTIYNVACAIILLLFRIIS